MKKFLFLTLTAWLLTACNKNTPSGIATKFLDCLVTKDYSKAKQYCTLESAMALGFLESMGSSEASFTGYEILRDSIVDNRAWVFYKGKTRNGDLNAVLELKKIDGKWKVSPSMSK